MKLLSITLLVTLLYACEPNPPEGNVMSQERFTKALRDSLQNANPQFTFGMLPDEPNRIYIYLGTGNSGTYITDEFYRNYLQSPADSLATIAFYAARLTKAYDEKKIHLSKVLPVIVPATVAEAKRNPDNDKRDELNALQPKGNVAEKYNDDLYIFYAEGKPSEPVYVSEELAKGQKIYTSVLHDAALANLDSLLKAGNIITKQDGMYTVTTDDKIAASFMLCSSLWNKRLLPVNGDFVIGIPSRSRLLVTGSHDKAGIEKIKTAVSKAYNNDSYPITTQLFKYTKNKFEAYHP